MARRRVRRGPRPFAETERLRLAELRSGAAEERADVLLALGRHAEVLPDLTALVAEHPLRERMRGLLMLALYRSGRHAEALQVFADGQRVLAEELGIDPGLDLTRLHEQVLTRDPALENGVGWLYAHLGQYDQALEHCGQALTLHRESGNRGGVADTLDSLGFAYLCLGDRARARNHYEQAIALLDAVAAPAGRSCPGPAPRPGRPPGRVRPAARGTRHRPLG